MKKNYTIVTDDEALSRLEAHIDAFYFFSFDTETTGLNTRKDKVIGFSICGEAGTAFYVPLLSWNKTFHCLQPVFVDERKFYELLIKLSRKELLMWNGSFDVRIVKSNFKLDLAPSLFADIMLMKHTVEEEGDFTLKGTAVELGQAIGLGDHQNAANEEQIALKANVAANGGSTTKANFEMYKADLDVMGPYACADADITFRLAEYYRQKIDEEGLDSFFYDKEVMPLYKGVTIKMEEKGIRLDLPKIHAVRAAIVKDMAHLEEGILAQLNELMEVQEWKRRRAAELYPPKNSGSFAQAVCEYYNLPLPKTPAGKYSLTAKSILNLPDGPGKSFLLHGIVGELGESPLESALEVVPLKEFSWKLFCDAGRDKINISSKQQMGQIVFDCLGVKPLSRTDKGAPQFDDDLIDHLHTKHGFGWARDLSNYNKLVKILGTYIDRFLEAQEDGYYYFNYKQHGTVSGRYSGDAQQMPRPKEDGELDEIVLKYVNQIRTFFIADEGRVFIDCDYESLEPHTFAHISGDEGLRDIFRKGHDFYSSIAIPTENLQGVSADKKAPNYLGKVNKPARQGAKAYALGIPYGMEEYALHKTLNCPKKEAADKIAGYLGGFPELAAWMERSEEFVKRHGYIRTESGRIRHLPKVKEIYDRHGDKILDWKYRNKLAMKMAQTMPLEAAKKTVTNIYRDYKNGLNNAKNVQVQGLGASIVNAACIAITKKFEELGIDGYVCAQIHDQAIFDVPEGEVEVCKKIVQDLMENTTKLSIPLKAPPAVAKNWKEGH
jgi:DNA polymerase I-like protein with 3'-5' exonuclease and polymerase domains